jgi:hypothetical protein
MSINIDMEGKYDIFRNDGMDSSEGDDAVKLSDITGFSLAPTSLAAKTTERAARAKRLRNQPTSKQPEVRKR